MTTEELYDRLCDVAPIIDAIAEKTKGDEKAMKAFIKMRTAKTRLSMITSFMPIMKLCKDEIFEMYSIMTDKPIEEIKKQDGMVTINSIIDIFSRLGLADFSSSASQNANEAVGADA